jgi:hypothetical protein
LADRLTANVIDRINGRDDIPNVWEKPVT